MMMRFTARCVGVAEDPELECLSVGVAEDDQGEGMSLIFQCELSDTGEEDDEPDLDSYCLVTPDQCAAYGAVDEVTLDGRTLRIVVSRDALDELELADPEIEVLLDVDDDSVEHMRTGLRRVLTSGPPEARPAIIGL